MRNSLTTRALKPRDSELRRQIKFFKEYSDDLELLKTWEPELRRRIYLSPDPADIMWRGEGHHQLALFYWKVGEIDKSKKSFIEAFSTFEDHDVLAMCRAKRDYALFLAIHESVKLGLHEAEQALLLHDDDLPNRKGLRQKRITEGYIWYLKLQEHRSDEEARANLVEFALYNCHDCSIRDQEQLLRFALDHAIGAYRQHLHLRLGLIYASRKRPVQVAKTTIQLGIDVHLLIAGRIIKTILRRV